MNKDMSLLAICINMRFMQIFLEIYWTDAQARMMLLNL